MVSGRLSTTEHGEGDRSEFSPDHVLEIMAKKKAIQLMQAAQYSAPNQNNRYRRDNEN
jgi:uncharacterized protein (DUF169 family)